MVNFKGSLIDFRKKQVDNAVKSRRLVKSNKAFIIDYRGYYVVDIDGNFLIDNNG